MSDKRFYNIENAESLKRRRESIIIFASALLIIFLTYIETHISAINTRIPLSNNILVFGLININIILVVLLIFLVLRNFIKLFFDRRRGVLGSKLRTKLVASFVTLTLVPAFLLFFIATGFITRSIEGWFGIGIEDSLKESLEVAKTYYKEVSDRSLYFSRVIAVTIAEKGGLTPERYGEIRKYIETKKKENGLGSIEVFDNRGRSVVNVISESVNPSFIKNTNTEIIKKAFNGEGFTNIRSTPSGDIIMAVAPISTTWAPQEISGVVLISHYVPTTLMAKMQDISDAVKEYRQLEVLKGPVKMSYSIILLIITLAIVFLSTWIGLQVAKSITAPIQSLAEGTFAVSTGNLDYKIEGEEYNNEIGTLVRSFNRMTKELKSNKSNLENAYTVLKNTNIELEQRRKYMEIVLGNVAAGVISIDKAGRITTINRAAEEMLNVNTKTVLSKNYKEVMKAEHLDVLRDMIKDMNRFSLDSIERQLKLKVRGKLLTLFVSLTILKEENNNYMGMVAVFDDLSHLLKTQRMMAWKEVARRIAHEIKNPLTPIKLSAQRLRKKYLSHFEGDGKIFNECTNTIIKQVDELKLLVNEFSHFARMPAANPEPNNINDVVKEASTLYEGAHKAVKFDYHIDESIPIMDIDRDQIKRAVINLLENSVESIEGEGNINIKTAYISEMRLARIEISDTGCGIAHEDRARLFEPYFSTKKSGTGLGLAIVSNIVADHHGYIRVKDNQPVGTRFIIELPVKS